MNKEEEILKNGLRVGNREVFRKVFVAVYPGLVKYGISITHDEESARELVQDVFLEIWERRGSLVIRGSVKSYLFGAVYHRSLNWLRSKKIREAYAANPVEIYHWLPVPVETESLDPLLALEIEKAIGELPPKCREAFTRCILLGESHSSAAAFLGLSEKTIENHVSKARKLLKARLKKFFYQ